ncbi:MAG: hypothetical protein OXM55_03565 [Bdellovibrionales bacterium]|nr:hypothetical protein [Bdellovibrionales bacterium]
MTDRKKDEEIPSKTGAKTYQPPTGQQKVWSWTTAEKSINYSVTADWILIRKREKPVADVFYTYYGYKGKTSHVRPITFVFNGGPGASSAYLHVGTMGPKTVTFGERGECLPPPAKLKDNTESWLDFTDLVFVDPVGTGFSRSLEEVDLSPPGIKEKEGSPAKETSQKEFYKMNRDLEVIGEFIQHFLSKYHRWSSPVFIAGESYGGFRVAKLSRKLQEDYGIGLSGVILISPCLELATLSPSDYDVLNWIESFPTMAATAAYHKRSFYFKDKQKEMSAIGTPGAPGAELKDLLKPIEDFALNEMSSLLIQGERMDMEKRKNILKKVVNFIAVPFEKMNKGYGRLSIWQFCRWLLQEERKWCGLYDASITVYDPFPDRDQFEGADPSLSGIEHAFSHGINTLLREHLELNCERQYRLLSREVNKSWKRDQQKHFFDMQIGATDDLRYAMAMNPQMKVFICHGVFDLVTPYFSSERVIQLMNLPEPLKKQISFQVFHGGHMFYTWTYSRQFFKSRMNEFYKNF